MIHLNSSFQLLALLLFVWQYHLVNVAVAISSSANFCSHIKHTLPLIPKARQNIISLLQMVCLMWVFTWASGQNCTVHARTSAATTTSSLGLALEDLKPCRLYICKLQNHLWFSVVGMLYYNMPLRFNVFCHQPCVVKRWRSRSLSSYFFFIFHHPFKTTHVFG